MLTIVQINTLCSDLYFHYYANSYVESHIPVSTRGFNSDRLILLIAFLKIDKYAALIKVQNTQFHWILHVVTPMRLTRGGLFTQGLASHPCRT